MVNSASVHGDERYLTGFLSHIFSTEVTLHWVSESYILQQESVYDSLFSPGKMSAVWQRPHFHTHKEKERSNKRQIHPS